MNEKEYLDSDSAVSLKYIIVLKTSLISFTIIIRQAPLLFLFVPACQIS